MKIQLYLFAAPLLMALANDALAAGPWGGAGHSSKGDCADCCVATMEKVKVKKTCFEVECEPVCIPDVRIPWPWQAGDCGKGKGDCCEPRCGKVRNVRVLTMRQYEETVCQCNWTPVDKTGKWEAEQAIPPEEVDGRQEASLNHIPTPPLPTANRYFNNAR